MSTNGTESAIAHPAHTNTNRFGEPLRPIEPCDLLLRWKIRRGCRKQGGHWWHPFSLVDWFCCTCGKATDGWPKDGSR